MRRPAYILVAVLALTALVTALGLSFVDSHSTVMPEAMNHAHAVRAQYLAESGVNIGSHFVMYPPTNVSPADYYRGASGVAIDATSDYMNISVLRSDGWTPAQTDLNLYRISATGVAHDADGVIRGKHTITTEAIITPPAKWVISQALLGKGTLSVPSGMQVYGDIHANGALTGSGWCTKTVSATLTALWLGSGPPAAVKSLQPAISAPAGTLAKYVNYAINGTNYKAYTGFTINDFKPEDSAALNAINMDATNPGRMIACQQGDVKVRKGVDLLGTIIVDGDRLLVDEPGARTLRAVSQFPAIVVNKDIKIVSDDVNLTIYGSVICNGNLNVNSAKNFTLTVYGSFILGGTINNGGTGLSIRVYWDPSRSVFWDLENPPNPQPITLLNWKES